MPLAAIPAVIGASLIGGGASVATSLLNKKKSSSGGTGGAGPLLPPGLDQTALLNSINTQKGLAGDFAKQGAQFIGEGHEASHLPIEYWSAILGGDRQKILEHMAPEVAAVNAQFRAPLTEAGISSRGSSLAPDLEASRQSAISHELFHARPEAADKLAGISQGLMSLGFNSQTAGAGAAGDVSKELLDYNSIIRGIQAQQSAQGAGAWGSLGASLGPTLAKVLQGTLLDKGGTPGVELPGPSNLPDLGAHPADPNINFLSTIPGVLGGDTNADFYSSWLNGQGLPPR